MSLVNLVIALIIVGVALGPINRYIPMASSMVVVGVVVWVLQAMGLWGGIRSYRLGNTQNGNLLPRAGSLEGRLCQW